MAYFVFKFYGFHTLLTDEERKEIFNLNPHENKKLEDIFVKL